MPLANVAGTVLGGMKGIGVVVHGLEVLPAAELILVPDCNAWHGFPWRHLQHHIRR